jgi:transposase
MLYATVSPEAAEILKDEIKQATKSTWYQRLKIILLSSEGKTVSELAQFFDPCAATIRVYIKQYNRGGLEALKRQTSSGAPPKIPLTKVEWEELLSQSPSQFSQLDTAIRNWSQDLAVTYLRCYHGVSVTRQAVASALRRHGLRLNRGRLKVTSPDPLYSVKRERTET